MRLVAASPNNSHNPCCAMSIVVDVAFFARYDALSAELSQLQHADNALAM